jgi:ABC-type multidrug transport system ATPase subunit
MNGRMVNYSSRQGGTKPNVIDLINVTKRFQSLVAIRNVSLNIPKGEVLGILGPNGAGKTTLFKLIAGLLYPDSGQVRASTSRWPSIGYKPERLLFPNHLTVRRYLELVAAIGNLDRRRSREIVDNSLSQVGLTDAAEKRIKECSKGMRQRLGLAQTLIGDPPLMLLDEPSNGLDPAGQADICQQIKNLRRAGKTIVLASHQLLEVTQVCTHLVIMNQGTVHYENQMVDALAERPHTTIHVDKDLGQMKTILASLHPDVFVGDMQVVLDEGAIGFRRQVLSILLGAGYDVTRVEQSRVTLAEIYAEAVQ